MPNANWMLGKDLTSLDLYVGTRNATTGAIAWAGSSSDLSDYPDYIRVNDQRLLDMIAPVNAEYAHYERTLFDSSLTVGEVLSKNTKGVLAGLAEAAQYIKVVFTRGGGTYTYLGQIRNFTDGISSMGKNVAELTLAPFFDGTNPPLAYAAA